jgi:hypothetical protein
MGTAELSQRTTVNIQEKANLIWAIADKLVGTYKPHEYGNVILPMCVIKRFSDTLAGQRIRLSRRIRASVQGISPLRMDFQDRCQYLRTEHLP